MNTLEELRASLATHADDLTDDGAAARAGAVHARVRHVRRQRRAALAGGLAVALVVAGLGAALGPLRQHRSADPGTPLAGQAVPRQVQVAGFSYDLGATAQSTPGARDLTLALPRSTHERVVSLVASGLGAGRATLFVGDGRPDSVTTAGRVSYDAGNALDRVVGAGAVDRPVEVSSDATRLTVRLQHAAAHAVVGLAVYDQGMPIGGVRAGGVAFPGRVGDARLVTAAIGRQGQDSISITFEGPLRHPDLQALCATGEKHIWGHVTTAGEKGWSGAECHRWDAVADADLGVGHDEGVPSTGYGPGTHTLTLRVSRDLPGHRGTAVDLADVRLALGLYDDPSPRQRVAGTDWDTRVLSGGRMWQLTRVVPYAEGRTRVRAATTPVMLALAYAGRTRTCLTASGSDGTDLRMDCVVSADGPSGSWGSVLLPGATYTLSTTDPNNDRRPGLGLKDVLIYEPAG